MSDAKRIAELNDTFRMKGQGNGRVMVTRSISDLGIAFQMRAMMRVRAFEDFSKDNDPHGERDFGSFELDGEKIFWKIDYYDNKLEAGSEDPADPVKTCRVLTVMLASDY